MRRIAPYVGPVLLFAVLTAIEGSLSVGSYIVAYTIKVAAVTALLLAWRRPFADVVLDGRIIVPSVLVGLGVFGLWLGIETWLPYRHLGERVALNPGQIDSSILAGAFLVVRFYGLVLLVPVLEEIFWRSFGLRYLTNPDFTAVAMGTFSLSAFLMITAAAAVAHPEWIAAALANAAYAAWLRRTRSLLATIVAHSATNAALGAWVLATGDWTLW